MAGLEINQLLFADDTPTVSDSEETLCRLVSEFGRESERRKLKMTVDKSEVMRYVNVGQMDVRINGGPFEEVNCFNLVSKVDVKMMWCTE